MVDASPDTILQFHDQLSNELPTLRGKWNFSLKVFRSNPYSFTNNNQSESKFLHTLTLSYLPETTVTLVDKNSSGIFTNALEENLYRPTALKFPESHLHKGATSGFNDPFDSIVNSKLQSLWLQKQNIKGDGGHIYELEGGSLIIRTSNIFLHGIFKGLLIQLESSSITNPDDIHKLLQKYAIPTGNLCNKVLDRANLDQYGDLCLQYAEVLNF